MTELCTSGLTFGFERAPGWPALARKTVEAHPYCAACGRKDELEVHHEYPVHNWPELELVEYFLIVLCRSCHFTIGHGGDWRARSPQVKLVSAMLLRHVQSMQAMCGRDRRYGRNDTEKPLGDTKMAVHPWPTEFPADAWPMIIDLLRGKVPEQPFEAWHVLWHAAGYISGKYDPYHAAPALGECSRLWVAETLEKHFVTGEGNAPGVVTAVPWLAIVTVLIELALQFLKNR